MNTSVMMERIAETSPRLKARGEVSLNWYWETRCWSGNRAQNNAFATAIGGRIPWRKANTNEPLKRS
jgi:hypothetical protein